ncbi:MULTISPECIES: aldehyde dehydrogenase family protein [Bosea]|uniref:aldehyde dehydrogenase family protein n=1 Tax=Bosea TaxID=85413 RepID=UPI00214FCDFD|nr:MULTISPECIES: aldehyde dehydrogenase family protein [Bosea]MCR4524135.1 aldehyde dehydrogenase family protein [Bosea sp. 47.2.35]MDR6827974.1 aldehyde dehydrogenase (NAD+) [Bosea robiniae]MDR6894876.1 aldehyde dehydrogenase (NAD+) [Bosea sp. BE109]MDR7138080.1 aldehyde dehydrogenase (NAD+) [Bosea sp. BE168]MDR7174779.1 aldehyde dehydrogenase (NAD+) [Bosea sp. BE271]
MKTYRNFIANEWRDAVDGEHIDVRNPSTGQVFAKLARGRSEDIDLAVAAARQALSGEWGRLTAAERGRVLARIATGVLANIDLLTETEARDVGKPLTQARADVVALARYLEFYGASADKVHGDTIPYQNGFTVLTIYEPHGVTGHIIPWNYPMQILGRSLGAALAMGNAAVVKPAEEACLTILEFARIAQEAGLPAGALNIVTGFGAEAGAALSAHTDINHISFTGSARTGEMVQAAAARNAVPVTLELGGKSAQVVFADADLDRAVPFLVNAGIQNAGQTCSASSRILVERSVYEDVIARMSEKYRALKVGPAEADLSVGPVVSQRQKVIVEDFLGVAHKDGLKVAAQGMIVSEAPSEGAYVAPTLLRDVPPDHKLAQEEIFGPVQVIMPFDTEEEALALANGTPYGLVCGIWTSDGGRQLRMARAAHAGQVFINNYGAGGGVELPFGGVKKSGHGREKGFEALYGFASMKTISIFHG